MNIIAWTITALLFSANLFATEPLSFHVKDPYPICIQELMQIEPLFPASYFSKKEKKEDCDMSTPCTGVLAEELLSSGLNSLKKFYLESFPKVEQEIFAENFIKRGDYKNRLKLLNDALSACQTRTEKLHKLAAEASDKVYSQTTEVDSVPEGYELVNRKKDLFIFPDSDVKAYVIRPKKPNLENLPPIISFAGTKSFTSAISDLSYGADQMNNVKVRFFQWLNSLDAEGYKELVITGHSLGGGLAQGLAAIIPDNLNFKTHLVTFNGFGGKDAIRAYEKIHGKVHDNRDFDKFQPTRDAVGYRMENDPVSILGERFGQSRTIPSPHLFFQIIGNHSISTVNKSIAENPYLLPNAKVEDVSPGIRPISAIVMGVANVKSFWNSTVDKFSGVGDIVCTEPFNPNKQKSEKCENKIGNALECFRLGNEKKNDENLVEAMKWFQIGCDLCHKDSCVEYAVTNKIVGNKSYTERIAKRGCDLGDIPSCIEAAETPGVDSKYITLACAYGEKRFCEKAANPEFAMNYNNLKDTFCANVPLVQNCELLYLSSNLNSLTEVEKEKRIIALLGTPGISLETKDIKGQTPLIFATDTHNLELTKFLISLGVKVNVKDELGNSPIIYASQGGDYELVKLLVEKGAKVDDKSKFGEQPILRASRSANLKLVKYLVEKGASLKAIDDKGNNPLHEAAGSGSIELIKYFKEQGENLNVKNSNGTTLLHDASTMLHPELVEYLIENGADIEARDDLGETALLKSSKNDSYVDIPKLLIKKGANVDAQDKDGETALLHAILRNNFPLVKMLVENGADVNLVNYIGDSPIAAAASRNNFEMVKYLYEKGAKLDVANKYNMTPLLNASMVGSFEISKFLIEKGAEIEVKNDTGSTPLLNATISGNLNLVKYLLNQRANLKIETKEGNTPVLYAAKSGNLEMLKLFLDRGAKLDVANKSGITPLIHSAINENIEMSKFLLQKGVSIEVKSNSGNTPLALAIARGNKALTQIFLDSGANIESKNNQGETPLHMAAFNGNTDILKMLIAKGANINSTNIKDETPLLDAVSTANFDIVKILVENGAKINPAYFKWANPEIAQYLKEKMENPFDVINQKK